MATSEARPFGDIVAATLAALKRFAERIREPHGHAAMREGMSGRELQEMLRGRIAG